MPLISIGTVVVTKDIIDRDGERILPKGAKLNNFKGNPIMLYNHNRWSQKPIGKWGSVKVMDDSIEMEGFISDSTESSKEILALVQDKVINTASMGFRPLKWSDDEKDKLTGQKGLTVLEYELMEVSMVDIPANPEAIVKGIDGAGDSVKICGSVKSWLESGQDGIIIKSFGYPDNNSKNFDNMNIFELINKYLGTSFKEDAKTEDVESAFKKFQESKGVTAEEVSKSFQTYDDLLKKHVDQKLESVLEEVKTLKDQLKELKESDAGSPDGDEDIDLKEKSKAAPEGEVIDLQKLFPNLQTK